MQNGGSFVSPHYYYEACSSNESINTDEFATSTELKHRITEVAQVAVEWRSFHFQRRRRRDRLSS